MEDETSFEGTETSDTASETQDTQGEAEPADRMVPLRELQKARRELQRLKAEREEAERKSAEKRGEYESLYKAADAELTEARTKLAAFEERETKRVESLTARNAERTKKLPKELQELAGSVSMDADGMADYLGRLEALAAKGSPGMNGGPHRAPEKKGVVIPESIKSRITREAKGTPYESAEEYYSAVYLNTSAGRAEHERLTKK